LHVSLSYQAIWREAIQTKLKRHRSANKENAAVQQNKAKFSRPGISGRPIRKDEGQIAGKDTQKAVRNIFCFLAFVMHTHLQHVSFS
jgi:hypothetical protein